MILPILKCYKEIENSIFCIFTTKKEGLSQKNAYPTDGLFITDLSEFQLVLAREFSKIHLHIDLESVAEADGVTEPRSNSQNMFGGQPTQP